MTPQERTEVEDLWLHATDGAAELPHRTDHVVQHEAALRRELAELREALQGLRSVRLYAPCYPRGEYAARLRNVADLRWRALQYDMCLRDYRAAAEAGRLHGVVRCAWPVRAQHVHRYEQPYTGPGGPGEVRYQEVVVADGAALKTWTNGGCYPTADAWAALFRLDRCEVGVSKVLHGLR